MYINDLIGLIKANNQNTKIVLGGYDITSIADTELNDYYPNADYFIKGFAEESIKLLLNHETISSNILKE